MTTIEDDGDGWADLDLENAGKDWIDLDLENSTGQAIQASPRLYLQWSSLEGKLPILPYSQPLVLQWCQVVQTKVQYTKQNR